MWFLFQGVFSYTANDMNNHNDHPTLQSVLKVFSLFLVQYQYKYDEVVGVRIQCTNCNKNFPCQISETGTKYIIPVYIKAVVFFILVYRG